MPRLNRRNSPLLSLLAAGLLSLSISQSALAHPGSHDRILSLNEQIEHDPTNTYLLIKRAQELIQEDKDYAPAKADLDRAHKLGATEATSYEFNFVKGLWHQYQKQLPEAAARFSRCIELEGNHLQCHRGLAEVKLAQKDSKAAIAVMKHFITSSSSAQTDDYFHLAQLLEQQGDTAAALMFLDQAQARFGVLPHFEKYAIAIEISQSNFKKALQRHQSLEPYFGKTPQWQYEKGMLFQYLGNTAQAKAAFEQALASLQKLKNKTSQANEALQKELRNQLAALN